MGTLDTDLLTRLERLEQGQRSLAASARRWRLACIGAILAGTAGIMLAAHRQPEVAEILRAEAIEILDADENVVLVLGSNTNGGKLEVMNADGRVAVGCEVSDFGGFVHVQSNDGRGVGAIDITDGGRPTMDLWTQGELRSRTAVDANECGAFILKNGKAQMSVLVGSSDMGPGMVVTYREDQVFAGLTTDGTGRLPVVFVAGREGSNAVEVRANRRGEGEVWVGNRSGQGFIYDHDGR